MRLLPCEPNDTSLFQGVEGKEKLEGGGKEKRDYTLQCFL